MQHQYLFTDIRGFLMQVTREGAPSFPLSRAPVSGALIPGWQSEAESDLQLVPDETSARVDPFQGHGLVFAQPVQPGEPLSSYAMDVRGVAQRAEALLRASTIADTVRIGTEIEFHLLKRVRFDTTAERNLVELEEEDGWSGNASILGAGHRIGHRTLHLLAGPADQHAPIRADICQHLATLGIAPLHHGHEAGPSQHEIAIGHADLCQAADQVQLLKHVVRTVAIWHGRTATFMPRPIPYAEPNGMHVNLSLRRQGRSTFHAPDGQPGQLSPQAMSFIAGVLAHLPALNAITNPTVNSYKRLNHAYSLMRPAGWGYRNRTTAIRVPHFTSAADCRIEIRFPDPCANPYLAMAALVCAGMDGIERELTPPPEERGAPKWYEQPFNAALSTEAMAPDLRAALIALHRDRGFLTRHGVFADALLDAIVRDGSFFWHWSATTPAPVEYQVFFGH
ncbi:glutamine synthetase family protein [Hydrogenophaga sp. T2]|uniref:glutamine synthetase family protein n=1 Tax=Hydrogenophaga sp. T2 TaxID=3132823 RepID=UPI003CE86340